jgi:hypothetical protein
VEILNNGYFVTGLDCYSMITCTSKSFGSHKRVMALVIGDVKALRALG